MGPIDPAATFGDSLIAAVLRVTDVLAGLAPQAERFRFVIAAFVLALLFVTILDRVQAAPPPRRGTGTAPSTPRANVGGSPVGSRARR